MAKCAICGEEISGAVYVMMIRRDGSEAEICAGCNDLILGLSDSQKRKNSLSALKKYAKSCGDYEVRRYLDGVISSADEPEQFDRYIEETRERREIKEKKTLDVHRLVRPSAFVLLLAVTAYGIFRAVLDFSAGQTAAGVIGLLLTAVIVGALLVLLIAVMDAVDDIRTVVRSRRRR